jgi:hypothetical protein
MKRKLSFHQKRMRFFTMVLGALVVLLTAGLLLLLNTFG